MALACRLEWTKKGAARGSCRPASPVIVRPVPALAGESINPPPPSPPPPSPRRPPSADTPRRPSRGTRRISAPPGLRLLQLRRTAMETQRPDPAGRCPRDLAAHLQLKWQHVDDYPTFLEITVEIIAVMTAVNESHRRQTMPLDTKQGWLASRAPPLQIQSTAAPTGCGPTIPGVYPATSTSAIFSSISSLFRVSSLWKGSMPASVGRPGTVTVTVCWPARRRCLRR